MFVLAASLWPALADASIWSWLEELSGPGPFTGGMVTVTLACVKGHQLDFCAIPTEEKRQSIALRLGSLSSGDALRFKDLPDTDENRRSVHVKPVSVLWLLRVHPSLQIGPGIGFMRVSGQDFHAFSKLSLTPLSAAFSPFALRSRWANKPAAHLFRFEIDESFFPQGFKGSDFENTRTKFDSGPEFLTRFGMVIDFGVFR
jgi:hypothetical protein